LRRVPLDSELCASISSSPAFISGQLDIKAIHLAWQREMDYPEYYNLLRQQRLDQKFFELKKERVSTNDIIIAEFKNNKFHTTSIPIKYTWEGPL
jgi:hypothetical protein